MPQAQTKHPLPEEDSLLLLVVGSTLVAEVIDRPAAYTLRTSINAWLSDHRGELDPAEQLVPVVCADLWFLNQPDLLLRPTVAVGAPSTNAATAYLAGRLPTALAIDGGLQVCMDPELVEPRACIWGLNPASTPTAVEAFANRYLDRFLRAVHDLPGRE